MIEKKDLARIGKFQKTHALKGELNAILDIDPDYVEDENPLIVEVEGIPVPFYAENLRPKGATSYLVKLEDVDTVDEAKAFVNCNIYALKKDLKEYYDEDEDFVFDDEDLEGYRVVDDEAGEIGEVERLDDSTENVLLVVRTKDGQEIFIPYVDTFIHEIDDENRVVLTSLPEELISLNLKRDK